MDDRLELGAGPCTVVLDPFDLASVNVLKDTVFFGKIGDGLVRGFGWMVREVGEKREGKC